MRSIKIILSVIILVVYFPSIVSGVYIHDKQADKKEFQPTQIIVKFKPDIELNLILDKGNPITGLAEIDYLHDKYSVVSQKKLLNQAEIHSFDNPLKSVYLFSVDNGIDIKTIAEDYAGLDIVEYAIPDYQVELYDTPNDPLYSHQWALNNTGQGYYHVERIDGMPDTLAIVYGTADSDIDAEEVFQNPPDNTNSVVVAIVDTGIDWDHPDLASMIWNNPNEIPENGIDDDHNGYVDDIVGWDFSGNEELLPIWEDNDPTDTYGHGTHCAGIVAATISNSVGVSGVVPDVKIMGIKFYPVMTLSMGAMGIIYAADNGADVVNMSWGLDIEIPVVGEALEYAASRGVVLIAAAGNDSQELYNYPASYGEVITVGATNSDDQVTTFSTISDSINVCAPGLSILSLRGDITDMYCGHGESNVHIIDSLYYLASGTSMASPHVVAVAAYLRSVSPGLSHNKIKDILQMTADDFLDPYGHGANYPGWDMFSGYGRINLHTALGEAPLVRAIISSPFDFSIVNGIINISGSADGDDFTEYVLEYSPGQDTTAWTEITSSNSSVTDNILGTMDCTGLEGEYIIRLRVGSYNEDYIRIFITDGAVAEITYPNPGDTITGSIFVQGNAFCQNFHYSVLEYNLNDTAISWILIDTITSPAYESVLGQWITSDIEEGTYTIRLQVFSESGLAASYEVIVVLKTPFSEPYGWTLEIGQDLSKMANYADVDKDGDYEVIIGTESTILFVNTDGTIQSSNVPEVRTADYSAYPVAVGRLDNDEYDDFVAVSSGSMMDIFPSGSSPISIFIGNPGRVFLRDINGDGIDEIHTFEKPIYYNNYYVIYNADGSLWEWCNDCTGPDTTFKNCLPADLDGDGICEIYCIKHQLLQRFDICGCSTELDSLPIYHTYYDYDLSAVDIDGDGISELIRYGRNVDYGGGEDIQWLWAFDENLQEVPGWPHNTNISTFWAMGMPMFGDLDEDGIPEYVAIHPTIDHSIIRAWNIDGTSFLGDNSINGFLASTISPGFGANQVILCDVNGNGFADITSTVAPDLWFTYGLERISGFTATGENLSDFPLPVTMIGSTVFRNHTMGDINKNGYLDMIYPSKDQKLVFHEFDEICYQPDKAYCPMYAYNRRLNFTYNMPLQGEIVCGDINGSGTGPNISDLIYYVDYLFRMGTPPPELWAADVDHSGDINVADLVFLIDYIFKGGPAPDC